MITWEDLRDIPELVGPVHWRARGEHEFVWRGEDWQDFILTPQAEVFQEQQARRISACGIYGLFAEDSELLYIGKSVDIGYRMIQHGRGDGPWRGGRRIPWETFCFVEVPTTAHYEVELAHILALNPPYNVKRDSPRWRGHKAMAAEVARIWEPHLAGPAVL